MGRQGQLLDITGQRFGMLTVVSRAANDANGSAMWICSCECGEGATVKGVLLRNGSRTTCGRHRSDSQRAHSMKGHPTHGLSATPEYRAWVGLRNRCNNPGNQAYASYGGRGISVCPEWDASFEAFLKDMGPRPSPAHSIEREDVNGNYEPLNCKWATDLEQGRNTRRTRYVEIDGVVTTLAEAAAQMGLSRSAMWHRADRRQHGVKFVERRKPLRTRDLPYHAHLLMFAT